MHVKDAVRMAKTYVTDLFADEEIYNVGLEEVEFDGMKNGWRITVGFSRPWDHKTLLTGALVDGRPARSYKMVVINDETGQADSLTDRFLNGPD